MGSLKSRIKKLGRIMPQEEILIVSYKKELFELLHGNEVFIREKFESEEEFVERVKDILIERKEGNNIILVSDL